jgi:hypothetical protein
VTAWEPLEVCTQPVQPVNQILRLSGMARYMHACPNPLGTPSAIYVHNVRIRLYTANSVNTAKVPRNTVQLELTFLIVVIQNSTVDAEHMMN